MQHKFKVGDTVECINNKNCQGLAVGSKYLITSVRVVGIREIVCVSGNNDLATDGYFAHRFKLFTPPTEVHSGGPYVCVSVYNELKKQNEALHAAMQHLKTLVYVGGKTDSNIAFENIRLRSRIKELEEELECLASEWKKPMMAYNPVVIGAGGGVGSAEAVTGNNGQHPPTHPPEQLFPADLAPGTYVAMDGAGAWCWYPTEPVCRDCARLWSCASGRYNYIDPDTYTSYMKKYNRQSWTSSLHIIGKK